MPKFKITDIFFDLDHTLWDFEANSAQAFDKLIVKHQLPVSLSAFLEVYEPINKQYWEDYAQGKKTKNEVKYNRLIDTFEALNIDVSQELIEVLATEYLDFLKKESILMDGTMEILDYLKPKYRLHILTNGFAEVQSDKMCHSGIENYFDLMITSEEIGKLKPHPEVFQHALQQAGVFAHNTYMIGDNLKSDILGAKNMGMYVVHYDPESRSDIDKKIIPRISHLRELKEIL